MVFPSIHSGFWRPRNPSYWCRLKIALWFWCRFSSKFVDPLDICSIPNLQSKVPKTPKPYVDIQLYPSLRCGDRCCDWYMFLGDPRNPRNLKRRVGSWMSPRKRRPQHQLDVSGFGRGGPTCICHGNMSCAHHLFWIRCLGFTEGFWRGGLKAGRRWRRIDYFPKVDCISINIIGYIPSRERWKSISHQTGSWEK